MSAPLTRNPRTKTPAASATTRLNQANGRPGSRTAHGSLQQSSTPAVTTPFGSARAAFDFSRVPVFSVGETNQRRPPGSPFSTPAGTQFHGQASASAVPEDAASEVPAVVQDVLRSPGKPL